MSDTTNSSRPPEKKSGKRILPSILGDLISLLLKILSISITAGGVCLIAEFALYFFFRDASPIEASLARYTNVSDFGSTGSWFPETSIMRIIEKNTLEVLNIQEVMFKLYTWTQYVVNALPNHQSESYWVDLSYRILHSTATAIPDLVTLWTIVTFTWIAKMLTILAMLLPCTLIITGGFVDGTVQRKIDTFKGTRDSQDKIEWWFLAFKSSSFTVLFFYIAIPNGLKATFLMLPSALVTAYFARNVVAHYKKYF
ncbi:DUF4400 domain-containing protein [Vibrio mediterranei]